MILKILRKIFFREDIILAELAILKQQNFKIMADLSALQADIAAEDTVIDSAITLIQGLAAEIAAIPTTDPTTQAAIDALAADVKGKSDALAAAVTANTPAADTTTQP